MQCSATQLPQLDAAGRGALLPAKIFNSLALFIAALWCA